MVENNIHKFPDPLELRAQKIEAAINRRKKGDEEWIEGTLDLAAELVAARKDHGDDDVKFGKWLKGRFGDNLIGKNDRAILIREGRNLNQMRLDLEKSDSHSLQMIFPSARKDAEGGSTNAGKTPSAGGGPKLQEAIDACLAYEAMHGKLPPANRHFDIGLPGITESTYDRAIRAVISGRELAETLGPLKLTKAQAHHIEMMVKLEVKTATEQLNVSFEREVEKRNKADIDKSFPDLEEMRRKAAINERYFREQMEKHAIFTEAEYRDLLLCTHESNPSDETRKRAFMALNAKKLQLTGKV